MHDEGTVSIYLYASRLPTEFEELISFLRTVSSFQWFTTLNILKRSHLIFNNLCVLLDTSSPKQTSSLVKRSQKEGSYPNPKMTRWHALTERILEDDGRQESQCFLRVLSWAVTGAVWCDTCFWAITVLQAIIKIIIVLMSSETYDNLSHSGKHHLGVLQIIISGSICEK